MSKESLSKSGNNYSAGDKMTAKEKTPIAKNGSENLEVINLKDFLQYVFDEYNSTKNIDSIKTKKEAIEAIIKVCKAKEYVGAGVGGLLIDSKSEKVLLYLRPKWPEKYKWSMLGGGVEFGYNAKDALISEYKNIAGITLANSDLAPLRITNHKLGSTSDCEYHFLSPAFIVNNPQSAIRQVKSRQKGIKDGDINAFAVQLMHDASNEDIEHLKSEISDGDFFLKKWEDKMIENYPKNEIKKYILKWFDIKYVISNPDRFSEPTYRALESYNERTVVLDEIIESTAKEINESTKKVKANIKEKIKNIQIHRIVSTDE